MPEGPVGAKSCRGALQTLFKKLRPLRPTERAFKSRLSFLF